MLTDYGRALVTVGVLCILAAAPIYLAGQRAAADECDNNGVERVFGVERPARERAASAEVEPGRTCRVSLHGKVREVSLDEWDYSTPAIAVALVGVLLLLGGILPGEQDGA